MGYFSWPTQSRSVQNTDYFNVMTYGAKGDGVTADDAAITAGVNAVIANGGGTLLFPRPASSYLINAKITIACSNIRLLGEWSSITFTNDDILFLLGGASSGATKSNIIVEGFVPTVNSVGGGGQQFVQVNYATGVHIKYNKITQFGGVGIKFNGGVKYATAEHNEIDNIGVTGIMSSGNITGGEYNQFIEYYANKVTNFQYGLEFLTSKDCIAHGNFVGTGRGGTTKYAIDSSRQYTDGTQATPERIIITKNIITDAPFYGINVTDVVDATITDNIIRNTGSNGITASISRGVISGNNLVGCQTGISANLASHVTDGTGGVSSSIYDACYANIDNNIVANTSGGPSFVLNGASKSKIRNNSVQNQSYAGYAFALTTCTNAHLENNISEGGSFTYGYRLETDCTGMTVRNNKGPGSSGTYSLPSAFAGWTIENGPCQLRDFPMVQTTDATVTTLYTYAIDQTNSNLFITAQVVGKSTSGSGKIGVFELKAHAVRGGAGASLQSGVSNVFTSSNDSNLAATITTSGNNVLVQVTGIAATNINWEAQISIVRREI